MYTGITLWYFASLFFAQSCYRIIVQPRSLDKNQNSKITATPRNNYSKADPSFSEDIRRIINLPLNHLL